ncbi:hypothetical protein HKD37_14G039595 [Glycine soja]
MTLIEGNWKQFWSLRIQPKIKHLIWRIQCDGLPSRFRLPSKGVQCPSKCPLCYNNLENNWHLFFGCENPSPKDVSTLKASLDVDIEENSLDIDDFWY